LRQPSSKAVTHIFTRKAIGLCGIFFEIFLLQ